MRIVAVLPRILRRLRILGSRLSSCAPNAMKIYPTQFLLGCCFAFTLAVGCMPMAGTYPNGRPRQPIAYRPQPVGNPHRPIGFPHQPVASPGRPIGPITRPQRPIGGIYNPQPNPGGVPWYPVGYQPTPNRPGIPIVMNPFPKTPLPPGSVLLPPDSTPTIPIAQPTPTPTDPKDDTDFWNPWPLPPRGDQFTAGHGGNSAAHGGIVSSQGWRSSRPLGGTARVPTRYVRHQQFAGDANSTSNEKLEYRGGRTIRDLFYVNLYVSGDTEWSNSDVERIDASLSAAMRDEHLNNVLLQYFGNQTIRATALPSHPLVGYTPKTVTRGDIENYLTFIHSRGFLTSYDLRNTVFNLLLPPGTVLTAKAQPANPVLEDLSFGDTTVPDSVDGDSLKGMAGYHGSVLTIDGGPVYFTVGVYSERLTNGGMNGIPVFNDPWKNVVATMYHQLAEARTNPDVEDALRESSDLDADGNLGWVSNSGNEIGDFPLQVNTPLTNVIKEVPLANGNGVVPVQLPYSNFAGGPEGPISQPHPLPSR